MVRASRYVFEIQRDVNMSVKSNHARSQTILWDLRVVDANAIAPGISAEVTQWRTVAAQSSQTQNEID